MTTHKQKSPPKRASLRHRRERTAAIDSPTGREYLGVARNQEVERFYLLPKVNTSVKKWHCAKILRPVKKWQSPLDARRSFYAVGQSCDTNLIPPETRNYGHCEVSPTYEGGINSVNVTNCRIRQGAVLPAGTKWLLITGLMERVLYGGHEQPSLDGLWEIKGKAWN